MFHLLACVLTCSSFYEATDEKESPESLQMEFATVQIATNNFSAENKLGQGGFGAVYKVLINYFYLC